MAHPIREEEFESLTEQQRKDIEERVQDFQEEIQTVMREVNRINHAQQKEIQQLADELARFVLQNRLDLIFVRIMQDHPEILQFLDEMQEDMVDNVTLFLPPQQSPDDQGDAPADVPWNSP
jgi:cobalamin biosynthesis Co2+ chelatase CbiK